jgi:hypothetical protein
MRDYLGNAEFLVPQFLLFSHLIYVNCETHFCISNFIQTNLQTGIHMRRTMVGNRPYPPDFDGA